MLVATELADLFLLIPRARPVELMLVATRTADLFLLIPRACPVELHVGLLFRRLQS
jgi:hypothetical protein